MLSISTQLHTMHRKASKQTRPSEEGDGFKGPSVYLLQCMASTPSGRAAASPAGSVLYTQDTAARMLPCRCALCMPLLTACLLRSPHLAPKLGCSCMGVTFRAVSQQMAGCLAATAAGTESLCPLRPTSGHTCTAPQAVCHTWLVVSRSDAWQAQETPAD